MPLPTSVSYDHDTSQLAQTYDTSSEFQYEHGKRLVADLNVRRGERVLDVGAGTGRLALHLSQLVGAEGEVVALDPLPERLAMARTRAVANLQVVQARAEDLSIFSDHHFDVVVLNSVLHWIEDQGKALSQIQRVLKPGGRLALNSADPDRPHDYVALLSQPLSKYGIPDSIGLSPPHRVNKEQLRQLLVRARFNNICIDALSIKDRFEDLDHLLRWNQSSYFGNFLPELELTDELLSSLSNALASHTDAGGIHLDRHLVFGWATKPILE